MLLGSARCGVCRRPATPDVEELALMRWLDEQYLATPFYGSRMAAVLRLAAPQVNRKRGTAADEDEGLEALDPNPKTSRPSAQHRIYPTCGAALRSAEPSMGCLWMARRLPPCAGAGARSAALRLSFLIISRTP